MGLKRLTLLTAPRYWDFETEQFVDNPQTLHTSGLFINTELDMSEIKHIVWATISGVEEHKIIEDKMTPAEEQRLLEAIEITKTMKLFIETNDNYDCAYLDYIVSRHVTENNVSLVVLDYIELTGALMSEFALITKGMSTRTDQVLLNLSSQLKAIARRYNVAMLAFTQVSENARRDANIRDAGAIKDSKSIQNKADLGCTFFFLTNEELEKIAPLLQTKGFRYTPNAYFHIYKNRGGRFKDVRVFVYQDLSTMRVIDVFATNSRFEPINIDRIKIEQIADMYLEMDENEDNSTSSTDFCF